MLPNTKIKVSGKYREYFIRLGISDFHELVDYITKLPYGRTSSREDFETLFIENKGTCSLKHGFLAEIAAWNGLSEIQLIVGIFLMTGEYSKGIESVLEKFGLTSLPEAHCYLRYDNKRYDFTNEKAGELNFEKFLIREQRCEPQQIVEWKPMIHKHYLQAWSKRQNLMISQEELWEIRETCIQELEKRV